LGWRQASYKLGGIIDEGGELIIYAPHLRAISETHGLLIEKYGYAPLDRVREMVALSTELQANLAVAAHSRMSLRRQRDKNGRVIPRSGSRCGGARRGYCERVNLDSWTIACFRREDYDSDPDTLVVERADATFTSLSRVKSEQGAVAPGSCVEGIVARNPSLPLRFRRCYCPTVE